MKGSIFFFCISLPALSAQLQIDSGDQLKLATLLEKLPTSVKARVEKPILDPVSGVEVTSVFPRAPSPFLIICKSNFYHGARFPSSNSCQVNFNEGDSAFELNYDEYRGSFTKDDWIEAMYDAIPYGRPTKELYSYGRDEGLMGEGDFGWVFHYHFICTPKKCEIRFSNLALLLNMFKS